LSRLAPESPHKLLYKAQLDDKRLVVVKFVSTYHADAHRLLAKSGLAPTLHYAGTEDAAASMYGGRYMIVMDFIEGNTLVNPLTDYQYEEVSEAIALLHSNNLVFGDLRSPNILITSKDAKIKIIDFDWCGRAGEARYPSNLNTEDDIWLEGVGPDSVMMLQHDIDMLKKLRRKEQ
jgi:serine/threonine protein kinase